MQTAALVLHIITNLCEVPLRIYSSSVARSQPADRQLRVEIANFMQHGQIYMRAPVMIEVLITVGRGAGGLGCGKGYENRVQSSCEVQLPT